MSKPAGPAAGIEEIRRISPNGGPKPGLPPALLAAVALLSGAALGYELLLMRLFSIVEWHHFAYMMISLALLGYGASGTFLTLARGFLLPRFGYAFAANAVLFGLSAAACFAAVRRVPFNALEILWNPKQWGYLALIYGGLVPPFFFAANAIGLALQHYRDQLGRVYAADLWGAAGGALAIVALLFGVFPLNALGAVGVFGFAAAALAWRGLGLRFRGLAFVLLLAAAPLPWLALQHCGVAVRPVEYKGLPQALKVAGAELVEQRSSPLGLLSVVRSPTVQFRYAPGLSLASPASVPEQLAVFTDGDGMSVINRWDGHRDSLAFLDWVPSALPYHLLLPKPKVLVLGAGGGSEVLQALYHGAGRIDAVELNPQMIDLVSGRYREFAGRVYAQPTVRVRAAEARGFVAASTESYDLIQLALMDAFTSSAGLYGLNESYLYTVEGLQAYLAHLKPGGWLALTRWVRLPPRDEVKLFATVVAVLERSGASAPARRLAWVRGWQTSTLLVKNAELSETDLAAIRRFAAERSFDLAWLPGLTAAEANVYNRQGEPYLYQAATALLGLDGNDFIGRYKFDIRPATDDRPYFFHFFKFPLLAEALERRGSGGLALLDLGYPVLLATLVQAVALSALFILAPLGFLATRWNHPLARRRRNAVFGYFALVGLAFMLTEIVYIQRFVLFLAHPLYAVAVVLAGFLLFAGFGSRHAATIPRERAGEGIAKAAGAIAAISALYLALLPPLFEVASALPEVTKVVTVLVLIAPLAFFMGLPFPLGLSQLSGGAEPLVPWAFGINGCASVIAVILATLLAIHIGQAWLSIAALGMYLAAAWLGLRLEAEG
jgi:spermidine synthase